MVNAILAKILTIMASKFRCIKTITVENSVQKRGLSTLLEQANQEIRKPSNAKYSISLGHPNAHKIKLYNWARNEWVIQNQKPCKLAQYLLTPSRLLTK